MEQTQSPKDHPEYNEINQSQTASSDHQPWVERNGFPHWVMAVAWVFFALIAFNVVGAIVGVIAYMATSDSIDPATIAEELSSNFDILFLANTSGQVLVMALGTLLMVKLHAVKGKRNHFLRLKTSPNVWKITGLAAVLFVIAQPAILFLGWLNSFVPVPEFMAEMQETMAEMISSFLKTENALLLGVFHIGLVPAICEEIMYRGYVMRAFEKSWGITAAIIVSGFIFGAYHLQVSNILPLATLGIFLAYVTYISDSLIPAMVAHFVNNGGQVIGSSFYPEMLDEQVTPDMELPWLLIVLSVIFTSALLYYMYSQRNQQEA